MSAFWADCPKCGARYFHMFVGMKLISGHTCPPNSPSLQAEIDDIKARLAAHRERKQRNPDE